MWDGWEKSYAGRKYEGAVLPGFYRSFNKKSVRNWGTQNQPGATLGLESAAGAVCIGTAFEIEEIHRNAVLAELKRREGKSFNLKEMEVVLPDGRRVSAVTAVNDIKAATYIGSLPLKDRARMARTAVGTDGSCSDYVTNIRNKLNAAGIKDQAVENFHQEVLSG